MDGNFKKKIFGIARNYQKWGEGGTIIKMRKGKVSCYTSVILALKGPRQEVMRVRPLWVTQLDLLSNCHPYKIMSGAK